MQFSRRDFLKLTGLGGLGLALGWAGRLDLTIPTSLYLLAPARSLSPDLLASFTETTGIDVVWRPALETGAGPADFDRYDLAILPAHQLTGLIRQAAVQDIRPISTSALFEQRPYDPFNTFSLPAGRGAIGINARGLRPPATWAEFFELARFEPTFLPCPEAGHALLKMSGESINTRDRSAYNKAWQLLASLQSAPLSESRLALGAALPGWNFVLPAEGAELWEDCFCIPARSPQPDLARSFIRFAVEHQPLAPLPEQPLEPRSPFAVL